MPPTDRSFLQGTLDVLILKTLTWGPMHGFGIASWLEERTEGSLRIEEGSLYPALHRMEQRGWISSEWQLTEKNRRAKFYRLTELGREQLHADVSEWERFARAFALVLEGTTPPVWAR